jgi:acetyl-CoA carboxylase biotin carboxyl carrier protein
MDLRKLKTLIDLVADSGIAELEVTEGEDKVRIVKFGNAPAALTANPTPAAPVAVAPAVTVAPVPSEPAAASGTTVTSPMVGTFYRCASPGAAPFVQVGQTVKIGETLCIIEAMKLLNEIESEVGGVIKEVLVENGQPVEYGQALFIIG